MNYEPSLIGGLKEAKNPGKEHEPYVPGNLKRVKISRENNLDKLAKRIEDLVIGKGRN